MIFHFAATQFWDFQPVVHVLLLKVVWKVRSYWEKHTSCLQS